MIWQEYGLDRLQEGIAVLFPKSGLSARALLGQVLQGDIRGAAAELFSGCGVSLSSPFQGMKNIFIWLLILGIVSSLMSHFIEIFDRHQVADLGFYFMYLLFVAILMQCFREAAETAKAALENTILFIRLLMPTYLFTIGVATGSMTAGAACQILLFVVYGIEMILEKGVLPVLYSLVLLVFLNGIWVEEKLSLFIEFLEKGIGWVLKGALGIITGFSIFQSLLTPVLDSVRKTGLQSLISALPGVGDVADSVIELTLGSAAAIKGGIGVFLLLALMALLFLPLLKIALIAVAVKATAAFMGIVSDRRLTACVNRTGDMGLLLFRTVGTAMLLFFVSIAILTASGGR